MKIVIPEHRAVSWNTLYSQKHWTARKRLADQIHMLVLAYLPIDRCGFTEPVHITVTATYKHHPVDCDNVCAKLYIDALKGRIIVDDSPQYIASVTMVSLVANTDSVTIEVR